MRDTFRIPLEGCLNFRDIGGYPCVDGRATRTNKFYRSNDLSKLTEADIAAVKALGVNVVVDLRFTDEAEQAVNRLKGHEGILYVNIPMADGSMANVNDMPKSMPGLYCDILHKGKMHVAAAFRLFAAHTDKTFVFHCTAGKDRTGVLAALLLDLAGVGRENIIADYALTQAYTWDSFMQMKAYMEAQLQMKLPEYIFEAKPESMEIFLDELYNVFGGTRGYLLSIGITEAELAAVLCMLVA